MNADEIPAAHPGLLASPEIGAVILNYGSEGQPDPLIQSLLNEGLALSSLIVVDNPKGEEARYQPAHQQVITIRPLKNLGYAGGMNLGIGEHRSKGKDWVLLLTQDVRIQPGFLQQLRQASSRAPGFGILGPTLHWRDRIPSITYGGRCTSLGSLDHITRLPEDTDGDGILECDWVDGSVMLIGTALVAQIGPMDERFFLYYEESEFCLRAKRAAWRIGVVPGAVAEQTAGEKRRPGAFNYLMSRNGLEFARLRGGRLGLVAALGRHLAQSWRLVKMRFSPRSDRPRREFAMVSLLGIWRGTLAYFRKRWGPPPANLPGLGDIRG